MARNHPRGWPGVPTARRAKAPFAPLDDVGRAWLSDALDSATVGHDQRHGTTDRHVILLAYQYLEHGESIAGRPFASLSVRTVSDALGLSEPTARASLARLSADGGPLEVVARPKPGETWGVCYSPRIREGDGGG